MDGRTVGLIYGFVDNFTKAVTRAETHENTEWELAEGTTLVFDAFGKGEESQATVTFTLEREGSNLNWAIKVAQR